MTIRINKDQFIENFIFNLLLPYIIYLKLMLSNDQIYKKLKRNKSNNYLNTFNLNFLKELINNY
jgi:uncharacterized membrane protein YciS (DUF1049 family)